MKVYFQSRSALRACNSNAKKVDLGKESPKRWALDLKANKA